MRSHNCQVVGVGASAGGLDAFCQFLHALPADTGMAFVLVQHLAPDHPSALAEILSRETSMPVIEVTGKPKVLANHVYVIPPGQSITITNHRLQLFQRGLTGIQRPIDQFFSSLAADQAHLAIGVVLSGTGTDGTFGLEEIKASGGITFAQDGSAQHEGMPQSAIDSGCVDLILPPGGIAAEIAHLATHPFIALTDEEEVARADASKAGIGSILRLLHATTQVDFSHYRANTLHRRITRRMILLKMSDLNAYFHFLQGKPEEVEALYQDILINVTGFFRDPKMYEVLKTKVIPKLVEAQSNHDPLRVWVLGCSTGEEAYSLAMALAEAADDGAPPAQIFATDLNAACIERARAGLYSNQRLQDVSPERIKRFFVDVNGEYRVGKQIRDMCVFAQHNVMSDPPFSRIDLVSCRNMLIYLEPSMQQRIIPILYYALNANGFLVLGGSESVGQSRDLFEVMDGKHKIYRKKPGISRHSLGLPTPESHPGGARTPPERLSVNSPPRSRVQVGGPDVHKEADRLLLARYAPPAVLVDGNQQILQFSGNTEPYLAQAPGKASLDLLKMARAGLLGPLRSAFRTAKKEGRPVREEGISVESGDVVREITVEILPVGGASASQGAFLVLFEENAPARTRASRTTKKKTSTSDTEKESNERQIIRLEHELTASTEYLQSVIEQEEAVNEELQSANEEAQSSNEELQSLNEELQTSKEEIESTNEELSTVNDELRNRNLEGARVNSDLINLASSVNAAIVMVGRDLCIRWFSPEAERLLNIIPTDVGRLLSHIRMNISAPNLDSLLQETIETVTPRQVEIQDNEGRWLSLRIRPYETLENKIDGAVLVLVDINAIKRARDYAESIVETTREPLIILDGDLRVKTANRSFYDTFKVAGHQTEGQLFFDLGDGQWEIPELRRLVEEIQSNNTVFQDFRVDHDFKGIGKKVMLLNARRLVAPDEEAPWMLIAIEDVTFQMNAKETLRLAEERFHFVAESMPQKVFTATATGDMDHFNRQWFEYTGLTFAQIKGWGWKQFIHPDDLDEHLRRWRHSVDTGQPFEIEHRLRRADGEFHWHLSRARAMFDAEGNNTMWIGSSTDIQQQKELELELENRVHGRTAELNTAIQELEGFNYTVAHDLRAPLRAIIYSSRVLLDEIGDSLAPSHRQILDRQALNAQKLGKLIDDLLTFSRLSSSPVKREIVNLTELVRSVVKETTQFDPPCHCDFEIQDGMSCWADEPLLRVVFINLIENACKFSPNGGKIEVGLSTDGPCPQVFVRDEGIGFEMAYAEKVFVPFERLHVEDEYPGTGIGLATVKRIVERHGGEICAESEPGKGTTFTFTLEPAQMESKPKKSGLANS